MVDRRFSMVPGAVLLGIGFVFLLTRFFEFRLWDVWQWGLVLGGALVSLFDRWDPRGLLVAIIGLVLWGVEQYDLRFRYVWPLLLIGVGIFLIARQLVRRSRAAREAESGSGIGPNPPAQPGK